MFTIHECIFKPTGLVLDYFVHGEGEYAWLDLHTDSPAWYFDGDIQVVRSVLDSEEHTVIGEVATKDEVLPYIKLYRLLEV